ncbi:MAG: CRISPR-associated endonuclease Cas1, partial [Candidatus Margulisiibacteriota bacterium]
ARIWFPYVGSIATIRRRQLEIMDSPHASRFVINWINNKVTAQIEFIKSLAEKRPKLQSELDSRIGQMESCRDKIETLRDKEDFRNTLFGYEGITGKMYFQCLNMIMPESFQFNGRSRQPAQDKFNAMLNYCYGILYSYVEKACIIAGLDPALGFFHTDNYNKSSLVFDIIENFRIYADIPVTRLCTGKRIKEECFDKLENGLSLNREGKKALTEYFFQYLDEKVRYRNRNVSRKTTIQLECHHTAKKLMEL